MRKASSRLFCKASGGLEFLKVTRVGIICDIRI